MFNLFKKNSDHDNIMYLRDGMLHTDRVVSGIENRLELLEKHLGVEYFNGNKNKPHYRAKRVRKEK